MFGKSSFKFGHTEQKNVYMSIECSKHEVVKIFLQKIGHRELKKIYMSSHE